MCPFVDRGQDRRDPDRAGCERVTGALEEEWGWTRRRGDGEVALDDPTGNVSGAWRTGRPPQTTPGALVYIKVDDIAAVAEDVPSAGGQVIQGLVATPVDSPHGFVTRTATCWRCTRSRSDDDPPDHHRYPGCR